MNPMRVTGIEQAATCASDGNQPEEEASQTTPVDNLPERLYTAQFFQIAAAAMLFMTGVALQFHFGQYMEYRGFGVETLGRVFSVGVIGTLAIRLRIGRWIDRFGCRPVWLVGTTVVAVSVGMIQFTSQLWLIVALRAIVTMATASVMTTVAVFAATIAPPRRRAESLGIMGLAGFVGMMIGPTLGDLIFAGSTTSIAPYSMFFTASAVCSLLAGGVIFLARTASCGPGGGDSPLTVTSKLRDERSQLRVIRDHWPGMVLLSGAVFGFVFCLQSLYLERLAEERGFRNIKLFFLVYAPTAMMLRLMFRRLPQRIGRTRTLLMGSMLLAAGLFCLIGIQREVQLMLPGILMGAGHCFIFPSMIDLCASRFPVDYRGTGTSLILGAGDIGMLIGYALLAAIIEAFGFDMALTVIAAAVLFSAVFLAIARRGVIFGSTPTV